MVAQALIEGCTNDDAICIQWLSTEYGFNQSLQHIKGCIIDTSIDGKQGKQAQMKPEMPNFCLIYIYI